MWSEDVKNIENQEGIDWRAQPIADKIISCLGDHKEYILLLLSERPRVHSDVFKSIILLHEFIIESIPQKYRFLVGTRAGDIVSETLGIECYVIVRYDCDYFKYNKDVFSFELRLKKRASQKKAA
jgi:hypothetical protein